MGSRVTGSLRSMLSVVVMRSRYSYLDEEDLDGFRVLVMA